MCYDTTLDVINQFIKLKILASFDDFFVDPFKQSSMFGYINKAVPFERHRKDKIIVSSSQIKEFELIGPIKRKKTDRETPPELSAGMKELAVQMQKLNEGLHEANRLSLTQSKEIH